MLGAIPSKSSVLLISSVIYENLDQKLQVYAEFMYLMEAQRMSRTYTVQEPLLTV